jgi:serine protease Do
MKSMRHLLPLTLAAAVLAAVVSVSAADETEALSPEDRALLYEDLAQEVAAAAHESNVVKMVVRLVSPTVVHIEAKKSEESGRQYGRRRTIEEAGSGVIVEFGKVHYILTNRHVVRDAELADITINLADGRVVHPTDVRTDPDTDIAVVYVAEPGLTSARLGNSDQIEIGDFVLAVGSPFGLSRSVTYGIISAKGRRDLELGDDSVRLQDFLQTDAAINPGNSGGPLINLKGEVIGINTAIASNSGGNEGIGFSIPINMVSLVARQLIDVGSVRRAYLGVSLDPRFDASAANKLGLSRPQGARITAITGNSPASTAKLQTGDVVLQFDGVRVEDDTHLVNLVNLTEIGKEVPLIIFRDRQQVQVRVKVGDKRDFDKQSMRRPAENLERVIELAVDRAEAWEVDVLGLTMVEIDESIALALKGSPDARGLLVTQVAAGGPSDGRLARGDIIDRIGNRRIELIDDLESALSEADLSRSLRIRATSVRSESGQARTVSIRPADVILP